MTLEIKRRITSEDIENTEVSMVDIKDSSITTAKLANGAVTTEKIADGAVTSEKLADGIDASSKGLNADMVDGYHAEDLLSGGSGALESHREAVPIDHPDYSITSKKIANASITEEKIADGAVTESKIADSAVTSSKIAPNSIGDDKVTSISESKISFDVSAGHDHDGVNSKKISHSSLEDITESDHHPYPIVSSGLADNSVTESKIADNSITTSKIADGAVTSQKIASGAIGDSQVSTISESKIVFDPSSGHNHDGIDSRKVSHSALLDINPDSHHPYPIPTDGLLNSSVTTEKIADGAVTDSKVSSGISELKISYSVSQGHNHDGVNSRKVSHFNLDDVTPSDHHPYPVPTEGISDSAITTSKISDGAVTDAKISEVSESKVAFDPVSGHNHDGVNSRRISHSSLEDITESDHHPYPVPMDGIADGAITDSKVASGISESKISFDPTSGHSHDGIHSAKVSHTSLNDVGPSDHHPYPIPTDGISDGAVTDSKIASGVSESKITYDINEGHNHDGVNSRKISHTSLLNIEPDSHHPYPVPSDGISDLSITTSKIADGAVTRTKISDSAVDHSKLASDVDSLEKVSGGYLRVEGDRVVCENFGVFKGTILIRDLKETRGFYLHIFDPRIHRRYSMFPVNFLGYLAEDPNSVDVRIIDSYNVEEESLRVMRITRFGFTCIVKPRDHREFESWLILEYRTSTKILEVDDVGRTMVLRCDCGYEYEVEIGDSIRVTREVDVIFPGTGDFSIVVPKSDDQTIIEVTSIVNQTTGEVYQFSSIGDDGRTIFFTGEKPPSDTEDVEVSYRIRENSMIYTRCPNCGSFAFFSRPKEVVESDEQSVLIERVFSLL